MLMLTPEEFRSYLRIRRQSAANSSLASIGRDFGVSRQAVHAWMNGTATPSATVLLLAERIMREPMDLADGLPIGHDGR